MNVKIEYLRFIFSILIVFFHANAFWKGTAFKGGYLGVEFFFILTGYLFAKNIDKYSKCDFDTLGSETIKYLKSKIKGFFLPFITSFVFASFITHLYIYKFSISNLLQSIFQLLLVYYAGFRTFGVVGGTWYLSAMLLALFILYPLARSNKNIFFCIVAPLLTIFIFGILSHYEGHLGAPNHWIGIFYKGFLAAIACISLGCINYYVSKNLAINNKYKILLTIVEYTGYIVTILYAYRSGYKNLDFVFVFILSISLVLTFKNNSIIDKIFDNRKVIKSGLFLGKFSLYIYLNHHLLVYILRKVNWPFNLKFLFLIIVTIIISYISMLFIRKISKS